MAQHLILVLLVEDWVFGVGPLGLILCKLYGFTRSLSYLATISILMLVAVERFLAIVHPFSTRIILLSPTTLKWTACGAWLLSGIMSAPALLSFEVFHHEFNMTNPVTKELEEHGQTICHRDYRAHRDIDWGAYEVVAFVLWYFIPCVVLIVLYSIIGRKLWRSSLDFKIANSSRHVCRSQQRSTSISASMNSWSSRLSQSFLLRPLFHRRSQKSSLSSEQSDQSHIVQNRRKVIKMLVVIVVLFMVCWFPVQMRKLLTYNYWNKPFGVEDEHMLYMLRHYLVPIGDWMINLHSACNPMVYMLLSDSFRAGVKDLFCRSRKPALQPSLHLPAIPL
ncbi:hypothetical protein RvY_08077-2 [Ramazzottius varieornatus]|nr:hypothetical protein RvY_08077-2 [Ramazzottius varieornatus]